MDAKTLVRWSCGASTFYDRIVRQQAMPVAGFLDLARDLGAEAVDLHEDFLLGPESDGRSLRANLASRRLACNLVMTDSNFCLADAEAAEGEVRRVCRSVDAAAECGAAALRVVAGPEPEGAERPLLIDQVVRSVGAVAAHAVKRGVRIVLENATAPASSVRQDITRTPTVFLAIWERVRTSGVQILFNTASWLADRDGGVWILKRSVPALWGIRLLDRAGASEQGIELGHGLLKLPELFRIIQRGAFAGTITVDYTGPNGLAGLRRCMVYARQVWMAVRP